MQPYALKIYVTVFRHLPAVLHQQKTIGSAAFVIPETPSVCNHGMIHIIAVRRRQNIQDNRPAIFYLIFCRIPGSYHIAVHGKICIKTADAPLSKPLQLSCYNIIVYGAILRLH